MRSTPDPDGDDRLKRLLDIAGATAMLVILLPLITMVALFVLATLGRPILFRDKRSGRHAVPFDLMKFRTMRAPNGLDDTDAARITRAGAFLRATSLDELPSLFNVLRGQMSLVGPRPLQPVYLGRYSPVQGRRHEVRPGVTGLAQVRGRTNLSWEQKFEYDVWYVDHRTIWLDLRILAATIAVVVARRGVRGIDAAPEPDFMGSPVRSAYEELTLARHK